MKYANIIFQIITLLKYLGLLRRYTHYMCVHIVYTHIMYLLHNLIKVDVFIFNLCRRLDRKSQFDESKIFDNVRI